MGLIADMQLRGVWAAYQKYVLTLEPILLATSRRGLPISTARHAEVTAEFEHELAHLYNQMQTLVPDEVKTLKVCKKKPSYRLPFKPSNQALVRYMRYRNHPVPKSWKSPEKDTTAQDELARLEKSTGDPLYRCVREYRDAQTVLRNHLKNWAPQPDGRVHPTFYNTATGQLEARRPNTMNAPHHKEVQADRFRSIVQARDGHTLLSFDYKGFHALYLAWEARDKVMERVARLDMPSFATAHFLKLPKCDEAMSWPDDQLRDWLKWVKREYRAVRDAKLKHALHGYDNGMRTHGCYMRYRDFFTGKKEVERILSMLDNLFSGAFAFRKQCVEQAHEQGYLISKFGCIRYFWEIKKWVGPPRRAVAEDGLVTCGAKEGWRECDWRGTPDAFEAHWKARHCWGHGDDAESAASFIQQNSAHCHLKDVMLQLGTEGKMDAYNFLSSVHDNLFFECPNELLDEARVYIQQVMTAPNATTGLSVGVVGEEGTSWHRMQEM